MSRATFRCVDRGIRVGRLGFFKPPEDPEFLEATGLIRFGLKRNTPGKWLRSSQSSNQDSRLRLQQQLLLHVAPDRRFKPRIVGRQLDIDMPRPR